VTTPRLAFPHLDALLAAYELGHDQRQAVTEAYGTFRDHHAPFMVSIAAQMLPDLRREVADNPRRRIAFLGRDGHSLATAVRALDPDFFRQNCSEIVLSRTVVEAALQDLENTAGMSFPQLRPEVFREKRGEVAAADVPGAFRHLTRYLQRNGMPVGEPASAVTVVDTSFKGSVQEVLAAMYPGTAFFGQSPHDPHPGSKRGYVVHLEVDAEWQGALHTELHDDPALTFGTREAVQVIEYTQHGPFGSPENWTAEGPRQGAQRDETQPSPELNPVAVSAQYRDPLTREAVKAAALMAIHDTASESAALRDAGGEWIAPLMQARGRFTENVRAWIQRHPLPDPRLSRLLDSFVARRDRKVNTRLAEALGSAGISARDALPYWQTMAALPTLSDKQTFVDQTLTRLHDSHQAVRIARQAFPGRPSDRLRRPPGDLGAPAPEPPSGPAPEPPGY
jgi:hypothetical protein